MKKWILVFVALLICALIYNVWPEKRLPEGVVIDKLVVHKSKHTLEGFANGKRIKTYTVSIGPHPKGDKQEEGDGRTPEGAYIIDAKNPHSGYHKNLGISYPNAADRAEAKRKGVKPGGDVKIHGLRNGTGIIGKFHRLADWTLGCIALTDAEVDELYSHVPIGTPILILP
ncbi:L,D-transpeptidase family protein [Chryseolinea lacunae]|nr:L,D-transpeptidase family protein [Chryseolinea lacunae]